MDLRQSSPTGHTHSDVLGTLAALSYVTGSDVTIVPGAASADVDATNLALTFIAPPSGIVTVSVSMSYVLAAPAGFYLSLREGAADVATTQARCAYIAETTTFPSFQGTATREWVIKNLTPGSQHTYKLGAAKIAGAGSATLAHGPSWGPVTFTVRA